MNPVDLPPLSEHLQQGGLYLLRLSDEHYYGGRAKQFRARWRRHLTRLEQGTHGNRYMQAVFNRHRRFDPEILKVESRIPEMIEAEREWLKANFGKPGCLNLTEDPTNNSHVSPEARKKISDANRGRKQSPEAIRRSAESRRGMKMAEEARRNNARAQTGKKMSEQAKRKMSESSARKGNPISDAHRAGIIEANRKRKGEARSEDVRIRIAASMHAKVWMHHPEKGGTRVPNNEVQAHLDQGWIKGRQDR